MTIEEAISLIGKKCIISIPSLSHPQYQNIKALVTKVDGTYLMWNECINEEYKYERQYNLRKIDLIEDEEGIQDKYTYPVIVPGIRVKLLRLPDKSKFLPYKDILLGQIFTTIKSPVSGRIRFIPEDNTLTKRLQTKDNFFIFNSKTLFYIY